MDALMAHVFESAVAWAVPAADGVVALLRGEIARAHQACVVEGRPLGREGAEYLRRAYESYRGLGGNDVGEAMYRQIAERGVS